MIDALCEDGVRRTAYITAEADTFFSIPAKVYVKRTSVRGFVTGVQTEEGEQDYEFIAYKYCKNHGLVGG